MGTTDCDEMVRHRDKFIAEACARGITREKAEEILDLIAPLVRCVLNKATPAARRRWTRSGYQESNENLTDDQY